jgi:hypothetical protein
MGRLPCHERTSAQWKVRTHRPILGNKPDKLFCLTNSLASDNIPETSNLALKAIMGIYAMGSINQILEARGADPAKTKHYLVRFLSQRRGSMSETFDIWSVHCN